MLKPFKIFTDHVDLIKVTTKNDIKQRYAGSVLGLFWVFIYPIIMMSIYLVVYVVIFKVRPMGMSLTEYVLHIFAGLIPFLTISEALTQGTTAITSNKELLKSTSFPIEIIPAKGVFSSYVNFIIGMFFVLVASLYFFPKNPYALLLPVVAFLQLLFLIGVNWFTSVTNVIFRDLQNIMPLFVMVLMLSSPIAYVVSMVPESMQILVYLNPFSYFVIIYQEIIAHRAMPAPWVMVLTTFLSFFVFIMGYKFFNKVKEITTNYA